MKSKNKKLCLSIKNKGGKAFIYKFKGRHRLILSLNSEDNIRLIKVKFRKEEQAVAYARKRLNDARISRLIDRELGLNTKAIESGYYPVYRWEHYHSIVNGHDDQKLSYWYKLGAGLALSNTRRSVPSWAN